MWYIYLKDSSLSKEAINVCIQNNIHTLKDLLEQFKAEGGLSNLRTHSSKLKSEIEDFCVETINYFMVLTQSNEHKKQKEDDLIKEETIEELQIDINPDENITIKELVRQGILSSNYLEPLLGNNIEDLIGLLQHYNIYRSFKSIRTIGVRKNEELLSLIRQYKGTSPTTPDKINNDKKNLFPPEASLDLEVLKQLLEVWEDEIKGLIEDYFKNEILTNAEIINLPAVLNSLYDNPTDIKGIGSYRAPLVRKILEEYYEICTKEEAVELLKLRMVAKKIQKTGLCKLSKEQLLKLDWQKPLKSLLTILENSRKLKEYDHFILNNFGRFKITEEHLGLSYEEIRLNYQELYDRELPMSTLKQHVLRAKDKIGIHIVQFIKEIPFIRNIFEELLPIEGNVAIVSSQLLDKLNEQNQTNFSNLFFDLIIRTIYENYISIFNLSNNQFTELTYVHRDIVSDEIKFKELILLLRKELFKKSTKTKTIILNDIDLDCIKSEKRLDYLSDILKAQNEIVTVDEENITFPPTRENHQPLIHYVVQVLEEHGKEMQYDLLNKRFDEKFPDVNRQSYRSLKDAMQKSDLTMPLGGQSNHYILKKWESNYIIGPHKELIFNYLRDNEGPRHYFEIFRSTSETRPDMRLQSVLQNLTLLDDLFKAHGGGFFSLLKDKSSDQIKFNRTHVGVYAFIEKNKRMINKPAQLIALLEKKYPSLQKIQFEFAIYQFNEQ